MKTVTIREAQHHLSKLVDEVRQSGDELVLTRRGQQVCKLIPIQPKETRTVDWKTIHREMDERLADLPGFERNPVLEMRKDERF